MVNICVVSGCKREYYPGCGISYHRIPANEEQRALWITAMNLNSNVSKYACVCSLHFKNDDFKTEAMKKLNPQAVPSILPKTVPESKKFVVVGIKYVKVVSSVNSLPSSDIIQARTSCERGGPSSKCEYVEISSDIIQARTSCERGGPCSKCKDVGISSEQPNKKVKQDESSTRIKTITVSPEKVKLRRDIKVLKQKLKRREIKIKNLKSILN